MPISYSQDVWYIRSLDVPHINPSILEGQFGIPSILPKRAAIRLLRYPPVNLVAPSISGDFKIPSVLTCNPGVWDAAPTADYLYQWRADGVDIPGETNSTWTSSLPFDGMVIDCVVTAVNNQGFVTLPSSNQITVEIVLPIEMQEISYGVISGLNQVQQQNMMVSRIAVMSGMWIDGVNSMMDFSVYGLSGMNVETRNDVLTNSLGVIEGLQADTAQTAYEFDVYMTEFYEYRSDVIIQNPGAEDGILNWTVTEGSLEVRTGSPLPQSGVQYFFGGTNVATTRAYNDVVIDAADLADVDANLLSVDMKWYQSSFDTRDQAHVYLEFLDATDASLGVDFARGLFSAPEQVWNLYQTGLIPVPELTRKIRIHMHFNRIAGNNNDGYVDSISMEFWQPQT